jgi:glycosyltransferase involved in cell wall biosynthesis
LTSGRREESQATTDLGEKRRRRILLVCDFGPGLLYDVLTPYEFTQDTKVALVRRKYGHINVPASIRLVRVPLPVLGTSESRGARGSFYLFANTVAYVVVGSLLSTYAALTFRCDVVHARFVFPEGIVGFVASILSRSKLVVTAEGSDVNLYLKTGFARALLLMLSRRGEFVSVSKPIQNELSRLGVESAYIPNSVDGSKFKFVPLEEKENLVAFVGTLTKTKRPEFLVEAVNLAHKFVVQKGIQVRIIGDGPLKETLDRMITRLGLEDSIKLEGYLSSEKVRERLAQAYAYVNCSKTEGMSLAFLEAMASGCLLLASNIPGNQALIQNGETGILYDTKDSAALAESIRSAFLNRSSLGAVTKKARESFESEYDTLKAAANLTRLYDSLERSPRGSARETTLISNLVTHSQSKVTLTSSPEVVLKPVESVEWMSKSVAFQKMVENRLFFSVESLAGRWRIAMAELRGGVFAEPRLVELKSDRRFTEMTTPNVVKTSDGYIMAFAGRQGKYENRRLFIAVSDTLDGPWEVKDQSYSPSASWEGRSIDLGPGNLVEDGNVLFFYSSTASRLRQLVAAFPRRPHLPTRLNLKRYEKRGIGILKVSVNGPHILQGSKVPLPLALVSGTPFEAVFCPGYAVINERHLLFMACSNYSRGFPFEQLIGVVESDLDPTEWKTKQEIRPLVTSKNLPAPFSSHSAFDTPDPVLTGGGAMRLYFSAMSRDVGSWSILACDASIKSQ